MINLATVLDSDDGKMLVEKYLEKAFLERQEYDTVLANCADAQSFTLPEKAGQFLEATRKGRMRLPEDTPNDAPQSDPASGATLGGKKFKSPIEFIREYAGVGTVAQMTSWIDLENWAKEEMPVALMRRCHRKTQAAFKVGRYKQGKYAADGTMTQAFDTTVEATPDIYGITWNFEAAPAYFGSGKDKFAGLDATSFLTWNDLETVKVRMINAGARTFDGFLKCVLSDAMISDLMREDKYFTAMVQGFKGEGLKKGVIGDWKGIRFVRDDEPFTENQGAALVRAEFGRYHTAIMYGKQSFAYTKLGGKSPYKPKFKVQDITKVGGEFTIGYTVPFQVQICDTAASATITAAVRNWEKNA